MLMMFTSYQIRGDGIGTKEVVPTINLQVPDDFDLKTGIYAARAYFTHDHNKVVYKSALHYGPRPTFDKSQISLELYVLSPSFEKNHSEQVEVEVIKWIRPIKKFTNSAKLRGQIQKDVEAIDQVFSNFS